MEEPFDIFVYLDLHNKLLNKKCYSPLIALSSKDITVHNIEYTFELFTGCITLANPLKFSNDEIFIQNCMLSSSFNYIVRLIKISDEYKVILIDKTKSAIHLFCDENVSEYFNMLWCMKLTTYFHKTENIKDSFKEIFKMLGIYFDITKFDKQTLSSINDRIKTVKNEKHCYDNVINEFLAEDEKYPFYLIPQIYQLSGNKIPYTILFPFGFGENAKEFDKFIKKGTASSFIKNEHLNISDNKYLLIISIQTFQKLKNNQGKFLTTTNLFVKLLKQYFGLSNTDTFPKIEFNIQNRELLNINTLNTKENYSKEFIQNEMKEVFGLKNKIIDFISQLNITQIKSFGNSIVIFCRIYKFFTKNSIQLIDLTYFDYDQLLKFKSKFLNETFDFARVLL